MSLELISTHDNLHLDNILCVSFNKVYDLFASAGNDTLILIWEFSKENLEIKAIIKLFKTKENDGVVHFSPINALDWSANGRFLAAASFDSTVSVWELTKSNSKFKFTHLITLDQIKPSTTVSFSISGIYLASSTIPHNNTIWLWNTNEEEDEDFGDMFGCNSFNITETNEIKYLKYSAREDMLFVCFYDGSLSLYSNPEEEEDGDYIRYNNFKPHNDSVNDIQFNEEGNKFFTASNDGLLKLWAVDFKVKDAYKNIQNISSINTGNAINNIALAIPLSFVIISTKSKYIEIYKLSTDFEKIEEGKINKIKNEYLNKIYCFPKLNSLIALNKNCSLKLYKLYKLTNN